MTDVTLTIDDVLRIAGNGKLALLLGLPNGPESVCQMLITEINKLRDDPKAELADAFMSAIETHVDKDWHPMDCPSEIVGDLAEELDELREELAQEQQRLNWTLNNSAYYGLGVLAYVDESGQVENRVVLPGQVREVIDVLQGNDDE